MLFLRFLVARLPACLIMVVEVVMPLVRVAV